MNIELALSVFGAVAAVVAGVWALLKVVGAGWNKQLDERFKNMEQARKEATKQWDARFNELMLLRNQEREEIRGVERNLMQLRAELPREYMRREDHVRFETVITARLDALYSELKLIGIRMPKSGE